MDDLQQLQADTYSLMAQHLIPFVDKAAARRPELVTGSLVEGVALLSGWNRYADDNAGASLLFHTWLPFLFEDMFGDETFAELFDDLDNNYTNMLCRPVIFFLETTDANIDDIEAGREPFPSVSGLNYFDNQSTDAKETRDEIVLGSLAKAVDFLIPLHGEDLSAWTWSANHTITFTDRASAWIPEASSGPYPVNGGYFTVDVAEFRITRGGELEKVFDVSNAPSQRTLYSLEPGNIEVRDIMPGGITESPDSEWFMSQAPDYLANRYRVRPFYYDDVVAKATAQAMLFDSYVPAQ
jgi:acyl-homoserine lactone acylase PvdQ